MALTYSEMAMLCLASGTHRIEFGEHGPNIVEREEPDPEVLYMDRGKKQGPFIVCPTPFSTPEGHEIEIILIREETSPLGFNILVNAPNSFGHPVYTAFEPRSDIKFTSSP